MKNKIKILFFINTVTSYQKNFFKFLNFFFTVRVVFYSRFYQNYNFEIPNERKFTFIDNVNNPKKKIFLILKNFKPNFVILGGYRLRYNSFIIKNIKKKNIKYFFWLERINSKKKIKLIIMKLIFKKILSKSDGILAIGNEAKRFYKKFNQTTFNLPYSISLKKKIKKEYFANGKVNFLYVGQLIERKGIDILLKAIKRLSKNEYFSNINFTILGEGNYKKKILEISKKYKNIKHYPFCKERKLKNIYLKNDVFVLPSKFDGWGVVLMEAMKYKMGIILTKNVGAKEILRNTSSIIIKDNDKNLHDAVVYYLRNKKKITDHGKKNHLLLHHSLCNTYNAVNKFRKIFNEKKFIN